MRNIYRKWNNQSWQETCRQFMQRILEENDHDEYQGRWDDITKKVCIDFLNFYGFMDVEVSSNWITTLEDYFEWYNMDEDERVPFVKMTMKVATCVW